MLPIGFVEPRVFGGGNGNARPPGAQPRAHWRHADGRWSCGYPGAGERDRGLALECVLCGSRYRCLMDSISCALRGPWCSDQRDSCVCVYYGVCDRMVYAAVVCSLVCRTYIM